MTFIKTLKTCIHAKINNETVTPEMKMKRKFEKQLGIIVNHQRLHMITIVASTNIKDKREKVMRKKRSIKKRQIKQVRFTPIFTNLCNCKIMLFKRHNNVCYH